jgi:hypothetical protein
VERLVQARAATVSGASMAGTVSGGAPRAHRHEHLIRCPEAPSVERGPEQLRGGLPVSQAGGVRRCNRLSVRQRLREEGRQA